MHVCVYVSRMYVRCMCVSFNVCVIQFVFARLCVCIQIVHVWFRLVFPFLLISPEPGLLVGVLTGRVKNWLRGRGRRRIFHCFSALLPSIGYVIAASGASPIASQYCFPELVAWSGPEVHLPLLPSSASQYCFAELLSRFEVSFVALDSFLLLLYRFSVWGESMKGRVR